MASSNSQNSRTPPKRTSVPATPSGNVHIFVCSTSLKYKFYPVEVVFPPLSELWVSNDHVPPKLIAAIFGKRAELVRFEGYYLWKHNDGYSLSRFTGHILDPR